MARLPRRELIDEEDVGVYHCVQRAVRRAFLCGRDPLTGKNFDHRKTWIRERLEFLTGQFGIDVLACSMSVDSSPIRAGIAKTPESSEYTSAWERIQSDRTAGADSPEERSSEDDSPEALKRSSVRRGDAGDARKSRQDDWLSPVELKRGQELTPCACRSGRASRKGLLPLTQQQYLELLDWTGRQARRGKRGRIPPDLAPILTRLQISTETWVVLVESWLATIACKRRQPWRAPMEGVQKALTPWDEPRSERLWPLGLPEWFRGLCTTGDRLARQSRRRGHGFADRWTGLRSDRSQSLGSSNSVLNRSRLTLSDFLGVTISGV